VIVSPCDIHTCVVRGSPSMSRSSGSTTVSIARPYSRLGAGVAAEVLGEVLRAVADAQQRQPALDRREVDAGGFRVAHGEGRARENHAAHRRVDGGQVVEGVDFAVNAQLAYAAGDELRVLRAEVDD